MLMSYTGTGGKEEGDILTVVFLGTRDGLCNWLLIVMLMTKWKEFRRSRLFKDGEDKEKYLACLIGLM